MRRGGGDDAAGAAPLSGDGQRWVIIAMVEYPASATAPARIKKHRIDAVWQCIGCYIGLDPADAVAEPPLGDIGVRHRPTGGIAVDGDTRRLRR